MVAAGPRVGGRPRGGRVCAVGGGVGCGGGVGVGGVVGVGTNKNPLCYVSEASYFLLFPTKSSLYLEKMNIFRKNDKNYVDFSPNIMTIFNSRAHFFSGKT